VDKDFTQLLIVSDDGLRTPMGAINWFAVHATSMLSTNKLISSDHKGLASVMLEKRLNPEGTLIGEVSYLLLQHSYSSLE
jgi:neutral ceramidase